MASSDTPPAPDDARKAAKPGGPRCPTCGYPMTGPVCQNCSVSLLADKGLLRYLPFFLAGAFLLGLLLSGLGSGRR